MKDVRELLSYEEVEALFLSRFRSERAKETMKSLSFLSLNELETERKRVYEAADILRFSPHPFEVSFDLRAYLERVERGGNLLPEELYRVLNECRNRNRISEAFSNQELKEGELVDLGRNLPVLESLEREIAKAIATDLSIKDKASSTLYSIRTSLRGIDGEMKRALEKEASGKGEYLSSPLPTIRNGKMVLAVKSVYRSKVSGAVIASSSSGETIFVEPLALLRLDEKRTRLLNEEKEEIERILAYLSGLVASFKEPLSIVNEATALIDFELGKASYMDFSRGSMAVVSEDKELLLLKARHPLLFEKAVSNDFELSEKRPILVISGPNAGGKTVALKVVGLLSYMARLGLPIPAEEGSKIPFYQEIAADIGDQQSLEESLSTFSGHLSSLRDALSKAGPKSLLLLDELGTGTAPKEGEAIAYGVISYLIENGTEAVVSSHFEGIKALAVSGGGVRNASMAYDEEKGLPTYRLRMDIPGESYGLSLAARYLPKVAVEKAGLYFEGQVEDSLEGALRRLEEATSNLERKQEEAEREISRLQDREKELSRKEASYRRRLEEVEEREKRSKEEFLSVYEEKAKELIDRASGGKLHEAIRAKKDIEDLFEDENREKEAGFAEEIAIGDYVKCPSLGVEGKVESLGRKIGIRTSGGALFRLEKSTLTKVDRPRENLKPMSGTRLDESTLMGSLPLEINLIGMRAAEAEEALASYIDKATLKGFSRVRIIHGFGGGTLRKVVRDFAASHPKLVKSFEAAGETEGMGGATIFYLK